MIQLSHPYMTTGKIIALTIGTFVCKVMSLLFNMLSRFVIAFLPRSKCLLISWLQSPSTEVLEPKKIKSVPVSMFPYLFFMQWWDWMSESSFVTLLFHFHQEVFDEKFLFVFCHKGGVICISEITDISSGNLDSSRCIIQPAILHDVLCT